LPPDARGLAFRLVESTGALDVRGEDIRHVSASARAVLHRHGVRIGAHTIFMPHLVRPRAAQTLAILRHAHSPSHALFLPRAGALSVPLERRHDWGECSAAGYRSCGRIAVRFDIIERLAETLAKGERASDPALARLICRPRRELAGVLNALGYTKTQTEEGAHWRLASAKLQKSRSPPAGEGAFAALAELVPPRAPPRRRRRKHT
jgi:ATP-dependent RNA helicase SUPV3L1/SUV3